MNRVLISSVSRKVSLVRAFKDAGWRVVGFDTDPEAVALKFCDVAVCKPRYNVDGDDAVYLAAMEHKVDLVVPTRDAELLEFAAWHNPPFKVLIPSRETIEICVDKLKFHNFCRQNGFNTPTVHFVKPQISKSGKEVSTIWQDVVDGREYSVDVFSDFEGKVINAVPRERVRTSSGESCVTRTVQNSLILSESVRLSERLGLVGHSCLQCFQSTESSSPIWTDVNCRYGGASIVGIRAGCNSPMGLKLLVAGHKIMPVIGSGSPVKGYSYTEWRFE